MYDQLTKQLFLSVLDFIRPLSLTLAFLLAICKKSIDNGLRNAEQTKTQENPHQPANVTKYGREGMQLELLDNAHSTIDSNRDLDVNVL